jgi:hypothetical protein
LRLAEETGADPVFLAIARAAAVAEAIGRDSLAELAEPDCADLADLVPETLDALALAEDQAGFLGEYLAAFFEAGSAERQAIAAAAAAHRLRAESLVTLSDSPDPRAVAYALGAPPADAAAASARWATVELTLARHYAQIGLELGGGAEPTIRWQLVQAHRWGAELPALP